MSTPFDDVLLSAPPPASASPPAAKEKRKKKSKSAAAAAANGGLVPLEISSPSRKGASSGSDSPVLRLSDPPLDYSVAVLPAPSASGGIGSSSGSSSSSSASQQQRVRAPLHTGDHKDDESSFSSSAHAMATPLSHSTLASIDPTLFERNVLFNDAHSRAPAPDVAQFPSNLVRTSKYTAWDFLPRNLFEQFLQPANSYFLFVGILQAIPAISTTQGIPTHYVPLAFILTVSAIRSAIEDYSRHQTDALEGSRRYLVYDGHVGDFVTKTSAEIVVGDVVKMVFGKESGAAEASPTNSPTSDNGAFPSFPSSLPPPSKHRTGRDPNVSYSASFPADMLFLSSSHEAGHTFVETASLDGESNLKIKSAPAVTQNLLWNASGDQSKQLQRLDLSLDIEGPNSRFDSFKGILHLNPNGTVPGYPQQKIAMKAENLLLRGTELRNTPFVLGLVVYTGIDSKIRRNVKSASTRSKKSAVMMHVNKLLSYMLAFQLMLCLLGALLCFSFTNEHRSSAWYLDFTEPPALAAFKVFFTLFLILAQLVPISLLVSLELVKTAQAWFIQKDVSIYDAATDQPCIVRNSQLHEDLGQVEYIFSDKTGTLTQNKMEMRVGFVGSGGSVHPFGSPDSEIARRVAIRMEQMREQQARAGGSSSSSSASSPPPVRESQLSWTAKVAKLMAEKERDSAMPAFNDEEKARMLRVLWGAPGAQGPEDAALAKDIRSFLLAMCISNTITPELQPKSKSRHKRGAPVQDGDAEGEYVLNFSSPDELALCKFAAHMGFQFQSRNKDGIQVAINKLGYGDPAKDIEIEIYQSLGTLDFNSKRKRVTCIYLRDRTVFAMTKGADANVLPLIPTANLDADSHRMRDLLDKELCSMSTKGLRTLVVAQATLPYEWWFGGDGHGAGMAAVYKAANLPDRGSEKGHSRGECKAECRICAGLLDIEKHARLTLLGATAIEDRLQDLVPEAIDDFLKAGVKVWMLTGDKKETAKNIALACNLLDPDQEQVDLLGSLSVQDMNRVIEITGDWVSMTNSHDQLRQLFDVLDCGGDIVDGIRTNFIGKEELRYFLVGLRVAGMDDDRAFEAQWRMVDQRGDDRIAFPEFQKFIKNLQPSHLKAVQTDIELGLRKARLIAGDGTAEEKRERLEQTPISLVVEGEAFSVFYPELQTKNAAAASPKRRMWNRGNAASMTDAELEEHTFSEPEALLLREAFFELASMCRSVICCRLTPAQKGRIVQEFTMKGHVTVAIGDGGNDELMIKRASIGVGISGLEGTAASRAADYAISSFRFLHTLMFVHGFWCYRRISKLVLFIFYKAALVAFSMYLFGFNSGMSGQQWFNDAIYILFNVCFTAMPIVILAIFDRGGLNKSTLEDHPQAYLSISHGAYFNDSRFIAWIVRAGYNALLIYGLVLQTIGYDDVSGSAGQAHGLWLTSTVVYTCLVMLVTLRILLECQTFVGILITFVVLSFVGYFPVVKLCSELLKINPNLYKVFERIFQDGFIWCLIIFAVALPLLVDVIAWTWQREKTPSFTDVLQERQRMSVQELQRLDVDSPFAQGNQINARVRTRAVPMLSQQQKDDKLLVKIRNALQQAQQDTSKASAGVQSQQDAQRRAEALVFTMTRLQNLSGSNFDATPQRNLLSLYEVTDPLTPAQLAELKEREAHVAAEAQKQHQVELLKQAQEAKAAEERKQRWGAPEVAADSHQRAAADQRRDKKKTNRAARRSSFSSADGAAVVLTLDGDSDEEVLEHEDGTGSGAIHLHGQLRDEPDDEDEYKQ